ncbi:MAG TPA: archaetidylserine decarboxylase [Steroidobacteraceae bacterium]|nr:archaetidylserine decarboxylase [Steroidobacteraceae bacterium]
MNLREDLSFLLTNRVPRRALTRFMGWLSPIEQPLVRSAALGLWKTFSDLDLSDAKKSEFRSVQDCFTRELRAGARPIYPDPDVLTSPCDGIVGASGVVTGGTVIQAKGFPYELAELLGDAALAREYEGGTFVTLRITPTMYHRFHAPADLRVDHVTYISGDTWNVYPIALKRVERLFCRNERAVLRCRLSASDTPMLLVPVAAILVASIRLHCADVLLHLKYRGPNEIPCDARYSKGEEMGWFQHGSTILAFVPPGIRLHESLSEGKRLRMGEPLLRTR